MHRTHLGFAFVAAALVACDDPKAVDATDPRVLHVAPSPIVTPPAVPRAALQDAGVVVVTANDLFDASADGSVSNDVIRAAQGAGYGDVEFAIKRAPSPD